MGDELLAIDGAVVYNGQESVLAILNSEDRSFEEQLARVIEVVARRHAPYDDTLIGADGARAVERPAPSSAGEGVAGGSWLGLLGAWPQRQRALRPPPTRAQESFAARCA